MERTSFIKEHKSSWQELEQLIQTLSKNKADIKAEHIDQLTQLYKKVSTHYAYVQTNFPNDELNTYLNALVSRAHHLIYKDQYKSKHQLSYFFKHYFIYLVHKRQLFILFALFLFMLGAFSGFIAVVIDPLNFYVLLPSQITEFVDPHRVGEGHDEIAPATFSAYIMTNNIRVAILAFVGGFTLGLLTIYVLLYNGLILGALAAVFWQAGQSYVFWAYILPHGIMELAVIFIAGGAGIYMGYRFLVPGQYSRKHQFLESAKESAQLLLGTFPLFILAGIIEGYITPSGLSLEAKYGVALLTLVLLVFYYVYGLSKRDENKLYKASLDFKSK